MAELVGISVGYEYQQRHKNIDNRIYVTRGNSNFAILFEQTTYDVACSHYVSRYENVEARVNNETLFHDNLNSQRFLFYDRKFF